jgi:hypothetical protein
MKRYKITITVENLSDANRSEQIHETSVLVTLNGAEMTLFPGESFKREIIGEVLPGFACGHRPELVVSV